MNIPVIEEKRLSLQIMQIGSNTKSIRCLDWDRDRFDIEFGLQNGTTYNSYLVEGEKIALVDTSHEKFRTQYLEQLESLIDISRIDYLIISHTEPDHSGLARDILKLAPNITVVASKVAINFLEDFVHQPFNRQIVKNGEQIDLGKGHILEFVSAPNLHWPDTMLTFDHATGILYTCDVFGMHYCSEAFFDDYLKDIEADYRFYYECLMAPNARSVIGAMKRMDDLPEIQMVANGHGPLLKHHVKDLLERYQSWSQSQSSKEKLVSVCYISDYGYSDRLSQAIARGITKTGVGVEMIDLKSADPQEISELVGRSTSIVIGMPPLYGSYQKETATNLGTILASVNPKQSVSLFESYGGDDEPIDTLATRFREIGALAGFNPIRVKSEPGETIYQICEEAGTDLGQAINQNQKVQERKALEPELDKALGRISGGLYIITAKKGNLTSAMLASWVAQASFDPPGFTISVAKDRAIESLLQVGDAFILNVLEENNYQSLMKHFLKRFPPGSDRFAGINTQTGSNGSPILTDSLAYLECEVVSRMECSDHWVIFSQVKDGRVSQADVLTAVHHRKVGNYY